MKTKTTITEITHGDLVNLFATALFGSSLFGVGYDIMAYKASNPNDNDTLEDKVAKCLLNGYKVIVYDYFAEEEGDFYGELTHHFDEDCCRMGYVVSLDDIEVGLERMMDGDFEVSDPESDDIEIAKESAMHLVSDSMNFDNTDATNIMQVVLFNELIY